MYWAHVGNPLHADFGWMYQGRYNGIPYNYVGDFTPRRTVTYNPAYNYANESDELPAEGLPIPDDVRIEGDPRPWPDQNSDHHMILVDTDRQELHELSVYDPDAMLIKQYSRWDLTSNALRPDGWTSADAAGLPVYPFLVKYDEAASGEIKHCLRFQLDNIWSHQWPGRHDAYSGGEAGPYYGMRVRMRADVDITKYPGTDTPTSPINRAILQCMKTYGMMLSDAGGNWFFSGAPDPRWDVDDLHLLVYYSPAECFEVVDTSSWMVDPDSAQARP